jgi:pyridoxine 4-dehydrogenase
MKNDDSAGAARSFAIGEKTIIHRLGFGTMRLTGPGIWGPPTSHSEALRTLKRARDLGVDFVDTADSYGPNFAEELVREALHPYHHVLVATKSGLARTGPDQWVPLGRPEYLIQQANTSCRRLGVEQIDLWQLHRIDPKVPRAEQFDTVKALLDAGTIRYAGLSEVSIEDIQAASKVFKVSTVQNRFNLIDRGSESVLDYCSAQGIGFIPWFPLASGSLTKSTPALDKIAKQHGVMPGQVALAWLLMRSPVLLPIPGTSQVSHLEENMVAAKLTLTDDEFAALDALGR